ncbi:MAG: DEAD/DEAH box helicase [Coleofasciculaceae cyanobacterium]
MNNQTFNRLAPFIQEYIYTHNWQDIRPVQVEACEVIFNTNAHLLLAAGTASGKTEAAFLPVLTLLHENPSSTIGILYISPIKALINDQFERLNDLLKEAHIPVWAWHGDVSQNRKNKLVKNPSGVLQITPESLESLLLNKTAELSNLFGDLRFIIIDEIHAFMGSERGCQILCQLTRLSRYIKNSQPRRIGLSATLGDYKLAEDWLSSGTKKSVITPKIKGAERKVNLSVSHFYLSETSANSDSDSKSNSKLEITASPYYQYLFQSSKAKKCLIFANNRAEIESVIANLRQIAEVSGNPDIYHVHHGSISASLREAAEAAMRGTNPAVTAATLTLELGIDIGQLERVIQLEAPLSVASFLQRLGRSGRRGAAAEMQFVCAEDELLGLLPEQIPWQLIQAIAIIQLYLEERWIEPIKSHRYPLSLLYHQTMSILTATGELSAAELAQQVLTLPSFQAISQADFRQLLQHLIALEHIQITETGTLIVGLIGESLVRKFNFYTVFTNNVEYTVREETTEIGSIIMPPPTGNQFALAGRTWQVLEIDPKRKTVFVKRAEGIANTSWRGGSGNIHTKILQRMKQVIVENTEYPYLQNNAKERLQAARQIAKISGLERHYILPLEANTCCIFPWAGTIAYRTLERVINFLVRSSLDIKSVSGTAPYFLSIKLGKSSIQELEQELTAFCEKELKNEDLVALDEAPKLQKYDQFVPNNLLRRAFASDYLDVSELQKTLKKNW